MPSESVLFKEKLGKIEYLMEKRKEVEKQLQMLMEGEAVKSVRKVNDYSITQLITNVLNDGKPRKAAVIAQDILSTTGHAPTTQSVRSAAKYMASRGKLMMDESSKEFLLVNTSSAKV